MSTISAGTTTGTALVSTGDTSGNLVLQVNGTTTAVTLNTAGAVGVGSSPSYGTSGQVLTSAGSAAAPTWASPAAGGSWIFLSSVTASTSSTVDIETGIGSTYDAYAIVGSGIGTSNAAALLMRWKVGGSYITGTGYDSTVWRLSFSATYTTTVATSVDYANVLPMTDYPSGWLSEFILYFYVPTNTTGGRVMHWIGAGGGNGHTGIARNATSGVLSGIRFLPASGTIDSGTFRLYGIKNS